MTTEAAEKRPHVGLFVTCLVDLLRPSVGFAAIKLLEDAGARVEVPESQTCCGQPAYNSGDRADAKAIARSVIETFERFDYVVAPSGSCAGMLRVHYPSLLADDPHFAERARALAAKSYELTSFLVEVLGLDKVAARFEGNVTYHEFLLVLARAEGARCAAATAQKRRRAFAHRDGGDRSVLRLRRHLLGQIPWDL